MNKMISSNGEIKYNDIFGCLQSVSETSGIKINLGDFHTIELYLIYNATIERFSSLCFFK